MKKKTEEEFNKIIKKNRMNENDNTNINKMGTIFNELYNYRIGYKKNKDKLKNNKYSFKLHINGL